MDHILQPRKLVFGSQTALGEAGTPLAAASTLQLARTPESFTKPSLTFSNAHQHSTPASQVNAPVRYCAPPDPDADYYSRFTHSARVRKYGLIADLETSDDEDDIRQEVPYSGPGRPKSKPVTPNIANISPVEDLMMQLKLQWQIEAEQRSAGRTARLREEFQAADDDLAEHLDEIDEKMHQKQVMLAQAHLDTAAQQLQKREEHIQALQRSHDKAAAKQQEQVERLQRAEEAARRQKEEEEAKARAAAEKAAAETAAAARAQKEAEEAARKQAEDKQKSEEAAKAAEKNKTSATTTAPAPKTTVSKNPAVAHCMRAAQAALAFENQVAQRSKELLTGLKGIMSDDSLKKQRRDIEKKMTVHVQQISATLEQVRQKFEDVRSLIMGQPNPTWQQYAMLMFATKFVKQWELVMLNNKAAFPLATVLVKVSTQFPDLMVLALNLIHTECCFSVPCAFTAKDAASGSELSPIELRRRLGYKELDDPQNPGGKMLESDDDFIKRVEGIMFLYGAIVQVPEPAHMHGLDYGWRWLSRFLNAVPASRAAAKALIFFLRAAGYTMHSRFRNQFIKLLQCMHAEFLPELAQVNEPDIQSVRTLLEHYLHRGQYMVEPEGHDMPKIDMSSYVKA